MFGFVPDFEELYMIIRTLLSILSENSALREPVLHQAKVQSFSRFCCAASLWTGDWFRIMFWITFLRFFGSDIQDGEGVEGGGEKEGEKSFTCRKLKGCRLEIMRKPLLLLFHLILHPPTPRRPPSSDRSPHGDPPLRLSQLRLTLVVSHPKPYFSWCGSSGTNAWARTYGSDPNDRHAAAIMSSEGHTNPLQLHLC